MKTMVAKKADIQHDWYQFDAKDWRLGRLSTQVARILMGKHKPIYTPHVDTGDFVVITNAVLIQVTGNKETDKIYYRHTGYPGGIRQRTLQEQRSKQPEKILMDAIKGMLPKGPLGRAMFKKLKVYSSEAHPHQAQAPKVFKQNNIEQES
jgi:large subunit ribosomal protein L13